MSVDFEIIVPAHNEEQYIEPLLKSLVNNGFLPEHIVVVDNGSTDRTVEIVQRNHCKIVSLPERVYPSQARNAGIQNSSADVLIFLDADVVVTAQWANRIKALIPLLSAGAALVGDTYRLSQHPSWIESIWFSPIYDQGKTYINGGNLIVSRKAIDLLGGFDDSLETAEDVEFSERAKQLNIPLTFDQELYVYHEGYPSDIKSFFRRERWHGRGDLKSWRSFLASKTAIMAALFLLLHLQIIFALVSGVKEVTIFSVVLIGLLCLYSTWYKFRRISAIGPKVLTIFYLYYWGRSFSIIDRLISLFR